MLHPLVVVVHRHAENTLGRLLTDDVIVEKRRDLLRLRQMLQREVGTLGEFLLDDLVAQLNALIADVHAGTGDQLLHLLLRLSTERALEEFASSIELGHVVGFSLVTHTIGYPA